MADLITLDELRTFLGVDPTDHRDDAMYEAMIPAASAAIRQFTERDFGTADVTEEREFSYDGTGFLDIDDAASVTAVKVAVPHADDIDLDPDTWAAMPPRRDDSPVFTYIILPFGVGGPAVNPAMGFTRNLDVWYAENQLPSVPSTVKVTGTFGWPDVPPDVKLATFWVLQDWTNSAANEGLSSESIETYSRAWGSRGGQAQPPQAIPSKARDILVNYQKVLF